MASGRKTRARNKANFKRQKPSRHAEFKREIKRRRTRRHNLRIDAKAKK